jgi:hypothetical protein
MDKFEWYGKYFEHNSKFLWLEICRMAPKAAAARLQDIVWGRIRLIKIMSGSKDHPEHGYESAGYWACQFSELTDVLMGLDNKALARAEIERFRDCARRQAEYQRKPEDQRSVFSGEKWSTK